MRMAQSTASCFDLTWTIQKPASCSPTGVNGPFFTVGLAPLVVPNFRRTPWEVSLSPSPASITPAFSISSL
jgi:hypothetical protein